MKYKFLRVLAFLASRLDEKTVVTTDTVLVILFGICSALLIFGCLAF